MAIHKYGHTQIWPYTNMAIHKYGHICVGFCLTPFPTSVQTSVFPFFAIQIVEENVCNTLGLVGVDLLGS